MLMKSKEISYRDFSGQYKLIRQGKDLHLGPYFLMRDTISKQRVIVKKHEYSDESELQAILLDYQRLCQMYAQTNKFCRFVGFCFEEVQPSSYINLIYEYHQTLDQELDSMILKNGKWTQKELQTFISCIIEALTTLERYELNHCCLKYSNLMIQNRNSLDLSFSLLFTPYLGGAVSQIKQNKIDIQPYNLAEQQLFLLNQAPPNPTNQSHLSFSEKLKIDKQSLGLMLLRMGGSIKHRIYNIDQNHEIVWDSDGIKARIRAFSKNYGSGLTKKLQYLIFDRAFYTFRDLPEFIFLQGGSNFGSHSRQADSTGKKLMNSRNKSSVHNSVKSHYHFLNISGSKDSKILMGSDSKGTSDKIRLGQSRLGKSKLSFRSFSPTQFSLDSPSKVKGDKYENLKEEIETSIFSQIQKANQSKIKIQEDNSSYVGNLKNGQKEGFGIEYFVEGDIYGGEWKNNQMQGYGTYLYPNCDLYIGDVFQGLKHGRGKYIYNTGYTYQGEWKHDKKEGFGTYYSLDRLEGYEGYWLNGIRKGVGKFKWKNGDIFDGEFDKGLKNGKGIAIKSNGTEISGYWQNDKITESAEIKFPSERSLTGKFIEKSGRFVMEGKAKQICPDGTSFAGSFFNNQRTGLCRIQFANKDYYEGQLINDKFDGNGTYYYHSIDCFYQGYWKGGKQQGSGKLKFRNGTIIETIWKDGNPDHTGTITYANGDIYNGEINRVGRNGKGTYTKYNGSKFEGVFQNGVITSIQNKL